MGILIQERQEDWCAAMCVAECVAVCVAECVAECDAVGVLDTRATGQLVLSQTGVDVKCKRYRGSIHCQDCCSVLQCVAAFCSVLQCVAVC